MIGTTIAGRYEIQEQIGIGGMGVVYCAHDATLRRDVAVKIIAPHLVQQAEARERFQREAQAVAGLTHPNIVAVYDFVEEPKSHGAALIMELLRGASLRQRMADKNRPSFSEVAIQTCKALEAAHGKGILHRDIKPENIFVCADGTLKLMDFGLARLLDSTASTQSGMIIGTISYMAPEQLRGEKLDVRTDLYALGVLLYEYLCGVTPFAADNPGAVLLKHLNEPPPPLRNKLPTLPAEIETIVLKLLAKDPNDRYSSATALREALENPTPSGKTTQVELANSFATLPTIAMPAPRPAPAPLEPLFPKPASGGGKGPYLVSAERKKRSLAGLLALPVILLAGGGAASYFYARHETVPLNMARKPQERKALSSPLRKTKITHGSFAASPLSEEEASLARAVRQEKAALAQERRERERLQRELAAKQNNPGYVAPGPDIPASVNDPDQPASPPPPADTALPVPSSSHSAVHSAPSASTLNLVGQANYLPQLGTVRVNVGFNDNCNVRFYALPLGQGQAVSVSGSLNRLNVSDTGQGAVPIDLTLNGSATPPPLIVMVASRRDLTYLKTSYAVPIGNGAARSVRQSVNGDLRGRRLGNDTVVRVIAVRGWNRTK